MPQYFFTVGGSDQNVREDPRGRSLPNLAAALSHAERMIKKLKRESACDNPGLMMLVKDEAQKTVLFVPFVPGGD